MTEDDAMSEDEKVDLTPLRDAIDELDQRIIDSLAARQRVVRDVARAKGGGGRGVRDITREERHLGKLVALGRDAGLDSFYVTRLYREVFDHSLRMQEALLHGADGTSETPTIRAAYQGTDGSYSFLAAGRYFGARGGAFELDGYATFAEMLDAVVDGAADFGVLPIENTTAGSITDAYDLLAEKGLHVIGEEIQRVDHCLLALADVPVSHIRRVYSQAPALAQCTRFLSGLSQCVVESYTDTAMAVKKVAADQDLSQAAIASEDAGRLYGLTVIKRHVANQRENYTRFLVVASEPVSWDPVVACKTSIIFATDHQEGALLKCLNVLASHHLNLTKLESRPRPNVPWEYLFYVDFEGNVADATVATALDELASHTRLLKVLGSYPARNTRGARAAEPAPTLEAAPRSRPVAAGQAAAVQIISSSRHRTSRAHRSDDTQIRVGDVVIGGERAVVIAGPTVLTDAEALRAAARAAQGLGARVLSADCFLSRTGPASRRGLRFEGVDILERVGRELGLVVMTSVVDPADVEAVARQVDVLRVRSDAMHDVGLLDAVGGVQTPVILERGVTASVDEWLEAAEHVLTRGNGQVILCERGVRTFGGATAATLDLSVVPTLRELTHLPVLVDPGQATRQPRWVPPLAEAALAAGAHGVLLELAGADGSGQGLEADDLAAAMTRLAPWLTAS